MFQSDIQFPAVEYFIKVRRISSLFNNKPNITNTANFPKEIYLQFKKLILINFVYLNLLNRCVCDFDLC